MTEITYKVEKLPPKPPLFYVWIRSIIFLAFFLGTCILINLTQFTFLPLLLLQDKSHYRRFITYTRKAFGLLLLFICQVFGQSRIVLSASSDCAKGLAKVNKDGQIERLNFPRDLLMISNHQIYSDWLYIWCLCYLSDIHGGLRIVLKASLKWIPIVGWGMQFFGFIFMKRSWKEDEINLTQNLALLSSEKLDDDLFFMIFPEGTLLSNQTRKASKKWANLLNIPDLQHTLLPRSLGTRFCLEKLRPPYLLDLTIGYTGVSPNGYGQQFYTLRSIYMEGRPPREVHIHVKLIDLQPTWKELDKRSKKGEIITAGSNQPSRNPINLDLNSNIEMEMEINREIIPIWDADEFDIWLRAIWHDKDERMKSFYNNGKFVSREKDKGNYLFDDKVIPIGTWDIRMKNWFSETLFGIYGIPLLFFASIIYIRGKFSSSNSTT